MGRMSLETRERVLVLWKAGVKPTALRERLREEGKKVSKVAILNLIKKFVTHGAIQDLNRNPRPSILQQHHYQFIDHCMLESDELTAQSLYTKVMDNFPD